MSKLVKIASDKLWGYEWEYKPNPKGWIDTQPGKSTITADNQSGRHIPVYDEGSMQQLPDYPKIDINKIKGLLGGVGIQNTIKGVRPTRLPTQPNQPKAPAAPQQGGWQWEEFNRDHYQGANDEEVEELRKMHNERQRRRMLEEARRRIRERNSKAKDVPGLVQRPHTNGINQPIGSGIPDLNKIDWRKFGRWQPADPDVTNLFY